MFLVIFGRMNELESSEGYGIPVVIKILNYIANITSCPESVFNWKEKRIMGLFLLNTALETAGESIGIHEKIVHMIQDNICKGLLLNSNTDDLYILSLTLRVVFNLF
jgi:brefeldin A-resistance guanine nucleotide exchange factor 1